jgi:spore maturation protein A
MLNYIWAGLIVASLVFALYYDATDLARDAYANGRPLPVEVRFPDGYDPEARRQDVEVAIEAGAFERHYALDAGADRPDSAGYAGTLVRTREGLQLRFDAEASLPEPLATVATHTNPRDGVLQGATPSLVAIPAGTAGVRTNVSFEPVRFVKMQAISAAALEFAETAASLALSLIGVLALFLGMLKIAEQAGVIRALGRVVEPLLRPLFPDIPRGHPAYSHIVLNLSANVFGLGNAATPLGIKAMEELQTLNPRKDTATNAMVMLLAMNTASVQLVPPVLLVALMGLQVNELLVPIILVTGLSLALAIVYAKLFARLAKYRATDPLRASSPDDQPAASDDAP